MVNTVQHKRGTTAQVNSYTGAVGEFIYNTTTKRIHAQDGATAGGIPHALVSDVDLKANASVTISSGSGLTGGGTLAANRTIALSSASIASLALADSAVQSVNGKTGSSITLTKADVGLSNVDNTSDASKPVSTATQTALNAKANSSVTVSAGTGLTGGGNLTANRSIALNSSSIASLGKADTALQAPGGTTGQILAKSSNTTNDVAWVSSEAATAVSYASQTLTDAQKSQARANIDADKVYNSISDVQSSVINSSVMAIRTNGYSSSGDGGAALYKRVAVEPSHAGKVQSSDGAWWEIDMRNGVNVLQFGAKGDGAGNDAPFIQAAIDAASTVGGIVRIPRGAYLLTAPIAVTQNTANWHDTKRVSLLGDGSGLTRLVYNGPATNVAVVRWTTTNAGDSDGTYGNSWAKIGGFLIEGGNSDVGLYVLAKSWFEADDIRILGAKEINFVFGSTVSWSGRSLRSYGSKVGFDFALGDDPLAYSIPNNITLIDCTVGNASVWGLRARNSGPINFVGGSFEANGTQGTDESGGAYFITNDAGVGVEGCMFNFYGTYFEDNRGGADVYVSQQSVTFPRVGNFHGANFNRVSSSGHTKNNVRVEVLGSAPMRANLYGCGFSYGGDYTPAASRRCFDITGDVGQCAIHYDGATTFLSTVDGPSNIVGPWNAPDALIFASLRCQPDGTPLLRRNIFSVTKNAIGQYTVEFNYPARSGNPQAIATIVGGNGMASIIGESANSVTVETKDFNGVTADQAFNLIVCDAAYS